MTAETSNARGEWPERYACNGPEGTFWTDDAALANKLIGAAFDRDEWTVTDTQNPTGAAPSSTAETSNARGEWVLVPRNPTEAMREAFNDWRPTEGNNYAGAQSFSAQERWAFRQRYAAMLAAAPALAQQPAAPSNARGVVDEDALRDARTIYDIACIRESRDNATREDVEFKAICLRNYNRIAALTEARNG